MSTAGHIAVSRAELLAILNASLAHERACANCQFDGPIFELRTPDASGSNWSDSLTLHCSGRAVAVCVSAAMRVAAAVRAKYNIKQDPGTSEPHRPDAVTAFPVGRFVYLGFLLDANRINARQADQHMNRLEEWRDNEVIELIMAESSYNEARSGSDPRRARKVALQIFSMTMATTTDEPDELLAIERILFPAGAHTQSQRNDVDIVFNAIKYRRILISADGGSKRQPGGILGNRTALAKLGACIMTAAEAVALVESKIKERDDMARLLAQKDHLPLPDWVGRD